MLNHGHAHVFDRWPELSIRGAGQEDRTSGYENRDFKQIATAGANTAAGSKFPPK